MEFFYVYPETLGREGNMLDAGRVSVVARAVEEAGLHGFAFTEHPAPSARWLDGGGHQSLDPLTALSHGAAVTDRIRLLTYLTVAAYRNPLLLAKSAATVALLSEGRLILGLGPGYQKSEFRALGADFEGRGALLDETLEVLPLHWSGKPFSVTGRHFSAREILALPAPPTPIPLWVGGNAPAAHRRVATLANGWMPLIGSGPLFEGDPSRWDGSRLEGDIARVKELAGDRAGGLSFAVPYSGFGDDGAIGDPASHRDAFARWADIGVTHVLITGTTHEESATTRFLAAFGDAFC